MTVKEAIANAIDALASQEAELSALKCAALEEEAEDAVVDNLDSAQNYLTAAIGDLRSALRDIERLSA